MNEKNAPLYLPLLKALAKGKTIQYLGSHFKWKSYKKGEDILFNRDPSKYRVKPEWVIDDE